MGRLVTERSKEVASIASGAGLPSASGCKDPLLPLVLSLSFAPELCSGAFSGLKDKKSWSEPDLSALRCEKVWFKVVGGQL